MKRLALALTVSLLALGAPLTRAQEPDDEPRPAASSVNAVQDALAFVEDFLELEDEAFEKAEMLLQKEWKASRRETIRAIQKLSREFEASPEDKQEAQEKRFKERLLTLLREKAKTGDAVAKGVLALHEQKPAAEPGEPMEAGAEPALPGESVPGLSAAERSSFFGFTRYALGLSFLDDQKTRVEAMLVRWQKPQTGRVGALISLFRALNAATAEERQASGPKIRPAYVAALTEAALSDADAKWLLQLVGKGGGQKSADPEAAARGMLDFLTFALDLTLTADEKAEGKKLLLVRAKGPQGEQMLGFGEGVRQLKALPAEEREKVLPELQKQVKQLVAKGTEEKDPFFVWLQKRLDR